MEPQECLEKFENIIRAIKEKWKNSKIIILLETERLDDIQYHTRRQILNMLVRQHFSGSSTRTIDHFNMMINSEPIFFLLKADGTFHLVFKFNTRETVQN